MRTRLNTVYIMVGPTSCGKSYFCNEMKKKITKKGLRSVIISSDEERRATFGENLQKYDKQMMQSSEKAFNILYYKLEQFLKYPNRPHFIFVDTTGLSEDFRNKVMSIVKEKSNYNIGLVVFDYKEKSEYYKHLSEEVLEKGKSIIDGHISRLKRKVFKTLAKKKYNFCEKIVKKDFSDIDLEIEDLDFYKKTFVEDKKNYLVISDIHGHFDEFKRLLGLKQVKIEEGKIISSNYEKIIINGDCIDKGKNSKEVLQFILDNREYFRFILGNHENFIYKFLKGEINPNKIEKGILKMFSSTEQYKEDKDFFNLLEEYINLSVEVLQNKYFIITHAPCKNKYLGMIDNKSKRNQSRFSFSKEKTALEDLQFVEKQARRNYPLHLFGHVAVKNVTFIHNEIFTDTGAGNNQKLTAIELLYNSERNSYRVYNTSVDCEGEPKSECLKMERESKIDFDLLEGRERGRVHWAIKNKVQFISGTMSPSSSSETYGLESLESGLEYFKKKGYEISDLVFQPKYMGSRCTLYLNKDISKCMMTSRRGYKISKLYNKEGEEFNDFSEIYKKFLGKPKLAMLLEDENVDTIILDGELMPWYAMGKGLIENNYGNLANCIENELTLLEESGFEDALDKIGLAFEKDNFAERHAKESRKVLEPKLGYTIYKTYINYGNYKHISLGVLKENLEEFKNQINLYGSKEDVDYKPFDILKVIYKDGTEDVKNPKEYSSYKIFSTISEDSNVCKKFNSIEELKKWYENITKELRLEGCVIKPEFLKDDCIPYMKVRNTNYLKLIYGYDYNLEDNLKHLIQNKKVDRKRKVSIKEFNLGIDLLNFKVEEITEDNDKYKQNVAKIIFEEKIEREIDPRL